MTTKEGSTTYLRELLVNEVAGHMPASGECNEHLIRQSARWAYDHIIAERVEILEAIYQAPGIADVIGDDLHEQLRAVVAGESE